MQNYLLKNVALNFKNVVIKGNVKTAYTKEIEQQFFREYDKTFLMSDFIQKCIRQHQLTIPIDFSGQSRFDDFAEDLSEVIEIEE